MNLIGVEILVIALTILAVLMMIAFIKGKYKKMLCKPHEEKAEIAFKSFMVDIKSGIDPKIEFSQHNLNGYNKNEVDNLLRNVALEFQRLSKEKKLLDSYVENDDLDAIINSEPILSVEDIHYFEFSESKDESSYSMNDVDYFFDLIDKEIYVRSEENEKMLTNILDSRPLKPIQQTV